MNPKGEEGEFNMKKSLLVLASIMILALCTFVACTSEVSDPYDGLTYVTFGGESPTSKNLLASYEVASYDSLYWFYTAEKKDNYGTSGAVKDKPVHEGNTGLNKTIGPFSQGKWLFTLCAYKNNTVSEDAKVYEGSVVVSLKGQNVTVPVSVTPCGGTGALEFNGVYFSWKENTASSTAIPVITIVAEGTTTGQKYTLSNSFTASEGVGTKDVKIPLVVKEKDSEGKFYIDYKDAKSPSVVADYYTSTIIAYIDDPNIPIFSQTLGFRVYGSATTVIRGNITEQSGTDVNFDPAKQDMAVFKGATTASVSVTPSGTNTTTVDFGANNLDNTSTYYLNVSATSAASAANKFTVSDSTKAPVAGIDLELVEVSSDGSNSKVRNFSGDAVTIITYIEKGLTGVTVKYNGTDGGDPVGVDYNSDTGKLMFTTNHFSEFYAVSDSVAVVSNGTTKKGYARLVDAIGSSKDGATIKLLKNIELTESIRIGSIDYRKSLTIDFNGYTISGDSSNDSLFCVENSEVVFTGKGFIVDKCSGYGYGAIEAVGSASSESKNYTVVTVGHEITINDGMAVWINHNSNETKESTSYTSYGVVVNFYGTANRGDIEDYVFYVNGKNKETVNAPVFNINGAMINSPRSRGIYAAGYAVWNIDNTVINSKKAAIEIRAGELNIAGGTFTATADGFSCEANGNGETTVGAAIAVAQHNTELPIDVVITGTPKLSGVYDLSVTNPQGNSKDAISNVKVTINENVEKIYVSTDFIREGNVIRAKTTGEDSKYVASLSDGRNFTTLKSAVDAVTNSGYITLLKDTTGSEVILIEDGAKKITIDFNDKTYVVKKRSAFSFGKGNNVTLKNGTVQSNYQSQTYSSKFIENYCDLTLDSITLDCSGFRFPTYVLFCGYGKTLITGETNILNQKDKDNKYTVDPASPAIEVLYNPSELYKEGVSVEFDANFTGKVGGLITLKKDKGTNLNGESYTHSLKVKGNGVFSAAEFNFPQVGARSVFEMNGNPTIYLDGKAQYPVKYDQNSNTATLSSDDFLVLNKTSDVKYEELGRAVNNSTDGQVLVLQKSFDMEFPIANQFNSKSVTIDLNGKAIGVSGSVSKEILTIASGSLTIEDSSNGSGLLDKQPIESFFKVSGGELVINGGTFKSDPTSYVNSVTHRITENKDARTWTVTANT